MALTVTNDPNVIHANAVNYSRALQVAAGGHVLWHPSHIVRDGGIIGDCGYFDGGRFQVLFNVFSPPIELGIPALPSPRGHELRIDNLPNHNHILQSSQSHTVRVEASLEFPPLPDLPLLKVDLAAHAAVRDKTIAFLAFCGPRRRDDWYAKTFTMERHLLLYEETILRHFRDFEGYPIRSGNIVIISGTTRTVSWWGGIARSHSTSVSGRAGVGGTGVSVEVDNTHNWPWNFSRGPDEWDANSDPDQALVLRVVSIKRRLPILRATRKVFTAISDFTGTGVRREGKGNTGNNPLGGSAAQGSSSIRVRDNEANSTNQRNAPLSEQPHSLDPSVVLDGLDVTEPGDWDSRAEGDQDADLDNTLLAAQPDILSEILDLVLRTYPDVDVAVGSWDAVAGSAKLLMAASAASLDESVELIVERSKQGTDIVAKLRGLKAAESSQRTNSQGTAFNPSLASSRKPEMSAPFAEAADSNGPSSPPSTSSGYTSSDIDGTDDMEIKIPEIEEGRGLIAYGEGVPVSALHVAPGTTHLLLASSETPNSLPVLLRQILPDIGISLIVLDISANFLLTLPPQLASCVNLEELKISANPLGALPSFLSNLTSLRVLIADSTGLQASSISPSLSSLSNLHTLSLRRNKLYTLPAWLCVLPTLETLLVDGNPFVGPWEALVEPLLTKVPTTPQYPVNTPVLGNHPSERTFGDSAPSSAHTSYFPTRDAEPHTVQYFAHQQDGGVQQKDTLFMYELPSYLPKRARRRAVPSHPSRTSAVLPHLAELDLVGLSLPVDMDEVSSDEETSSSGPPRSANRRSFLSIDQVSILSSADTVTSASSVDTVTSASSVETVTSAASVETVTSPHTVWTSSNFMKIVGDDDAGTDADSPLSDHTPQDDMLPTLARPQTRALRSVMAYLRDLSDLGEEGRRREGVRGSDQRQRGSTIGEQVASSSSSPSAGIDKDTDAKQYDDDKGKRRTTLREILETERAYVKGLEELIDIYIKPAAVPASILSNVAGKETVVPASERKIVFNSLETLLSFHKESFLPALEAAAVPLYPATDDEDGHVSTVLDDEDGHVSTVLDDEDGHVSTVVAITIANVFLSHAAFMRMYSTYISNFDDSIHRLKDWTRSSDGPDSPLTIETASNLLSTNQRKRIKGYLKRCRRHPRHSKLNLEEYLQLPVLRIPQYRLLLEELARSTPRKPNAYNDPLDRALVEISALANKMNEAKRDSESRKKLVQWQSRIRGKFPSPLVQAHRRFIMDGHLTCTRVVHKSTTSIEVVHPSGGENTVIQVDCLETDVSSRDLVAILCNDLLALCKDHSDDTLVDLWAVLRMQTVPQPASVVDGNVLRIVDNKAILYFETASTSEALSWSRAINLHVPVLKA